MITTLRTYTINDMCFNEKLNTINQKISYLINHKGLRRYGVNTFWLFLEQILRMIAGFLVGVWVARYLGPQKYGIFSYALAFVSIFGGIAKLGLDGIVVRDLVKEPDKRDEYLGTAFWLKLIGGVITFLIVIVAIQFTKNDTLTNIFILIIASGIIFQSFEVIDFYYQATVQAKYISLRKIIQLIISSLIKIYLVIVKADLIWFVLVTLFDAISLAIFSWIIYKSQGLPAFFKYFKIDTAKEFLKDSWPLVLSSIAISIYMRIDQVMIKNMLGEREVGLYSAAVRLVELWYFIPMIITNSVFPAIVNAKKTSEELYYRRLKNLYSLMIWLAIGISLPVSLTSSWIIEFLYGNAYIEASKVLTISIWASVFVFLGVASGNWFISENLQKYSFYRTLTGAVINITLNLLLIPHYSIYGAAFATLVSQAVASYLFNLTNKNLRYTFWIQTKALFPFGKL